MRKNFVPKKGAEIPRQGCQRNQTETNIWPFVSVSALSCLPPNELPPLNLTSDMCPPSTQTLSLKASSQMLSIRQATCRWLMKHQQMRLRKWKGDYWPYNNYYLSRMSAFKLHNKPFSWHQPDNMTNGIPYLVAMKSLLRHLPCSGWCLLNQQHALLSQRGGESDLSNSRLVIFCPSLRN